MSSDIKYLYEARYWFPGSCLLLFVVYRLVYAKYLSPTKHVPGDLIDKLSGVRFLMSTITGHKMYFAHEKLIKHGTSDLSIC